MEKDISSYVAGWRKRISAEIEHCKQLQRQARNDAKRMACSLTDNFPCERIYLIGSTAREGEFTERSDIDLVIEGLPPEVYFRASATISKLTNFKVDLIPYENANSLIHRKIQEEGVLLYDSEE